MYYVPFKYFILQIIQYAVIKSTYLFPLILIVTIQFTQKEYIFINNYYSIFFFRFRYVLFKTFA